MSKKTHEKIYKDVEENNVRFLRLMFTDIQGALKNVEVPISQLDKVLDGQMMFDGSSIEGFVRESEADMYLVPDLSTWLIFPWEINTTLPTRVGRLICDVYNPDGSPFSGDPRNNLKRVLKEAEEMGFTDFNLGPEPEFFLFKMEGKEDNFISNELNDHGGYFDLAPIDLAENCRRDIVLELQELGFEIEASHHEGGPGQHEIDWKYATALEACDNIQTFKLIVKSVARKYNLHATFMPKPLHDIHGSGMHMNLSLFKKNENVFYDPASEIGLSDTAFKFLSGLMHHAQGFTAVTNPTVNSYKRLVPGFEAPVQIAWSANSRTPMFRIPSSRGKSTRIEVRSVDPSTNPYLALTVLLKAGLDGLKNDYPLDEPVNDLNSNEEVSDQKVDNLPSSLKEALNELKENTVIQDALGPHIYDRFIKIKEFEWEQFTIAVTDWEKNQYAEL